MLLTCIVLEFYLWLILFHIQVLSEILNGHTLQVEALAVKLTQKEGELIQEKYEVKKLASYLKQVI